MKIIIVTQDAPMYLASFLDNFFSLIVGTNHSVENIVILSPLFENSLLKEMRKRYYYYGFVDFIKMMYYVIRDKFLSIIFHIYPSVGCYSINNIIDKYQIKEYKIDSINSKKFIDYIKNSQIDLIISVACSQVFKKELLDIPKKTYINYHTSLLPKYRGRQPLFWALLNKEKQVGISIHEIDEKLDNGPIIVQRKVIIDNKDTLHSLYLKTIKIGPKLLLDAINKIGNDFSDRIKNDSKKATYYNFPAKEDAIIFKSNRKRFF